MIVLLVTYNVKDGQVETVIDLLQQMSAAIKAAESGCALYQAVRSRDNGNELVLIEQYDSEASLAAHRETPHFKAIVEAQIIPLLSSRERRTFDLVV
jgi:quinol monooxygenase YgiN